MTIVTREHAERHLDHLARTRARTTGEPYEVAFAKVVETADGAFYYRLGLRDEYERHARASGAGDYAVQKKLSQEAKDAIFEVILREAAVKFPTMNEPEAVARFLQTTDGKRLWEAYDDAERRPLKL